MQTNNTMAEIGSYTLELFVFCGPFYVRARVCFFTQVVNDSYLSGMIDIIAVRLDLWCFLRSASDLQHNPLVIQTNLAGDT
jgi:hypothetical protein